MDMNVNTSEVKYTKDEEPSVMDILLIKAPGYFKLFECGKEFFNNLDAAYECACMENAKDKYWGEMYDTITNYKDWNHAPLSNEKIREVIDKVILEEQVEANNVTVYTFSPQINESEDLITKVANATISNELGNDLIHKVANMTIKNARNDLNGANTGDVRVQFLGNPAGKFHQNLLSSQKIRIRHKEVPVLLLVQTINRL